MGIEVTLLGENLEMPLWKEQSCIHGVWPSSVADSSSSAGDKWVWWNSERGTYALCYEACGWGGAPLLVRIGNEVRLVWFRLG
jgi:hypothetical protein